MTAAARLAGELITRDSICEGKWLLSPCSLRGHLERGMTQLYVQAIA